MDYADFIVIPLFLLAAALCGTTAFLSHKLGRDHGNAKDTAMWTIFTLIFLVFILMKTQRVVQNLGNAARDEARTSGLYDDRHPFQVAAVATAAILGLAQAAYFSSYIAQRWRRYRWPLIGTGTIICFAIIRGVSLHEIDALGNWLPVAKGIIESLAAAGVIWGAWSRIKRLQKTSPKSGKLKATT